MLSAARSLESLADSEALDGSLLAGQTERGLVSLLHLRRLLVALELDVAVRGEVGADATVGAVGATATGDGALHDDVVDDAVVDVELCSLGVRLQVDEELTHALDRLLGPAALRVLEGLDLGVAADATRVPAEGDDALVLQALLHVLDRLLQVPALHGAGDLVRVLVVGAQVRDSALSRCTPTNRTEKSQITHSRK